MKLTREEMMIKAVAAMTEMRIIPSYISALKRKKNSTKTMFIRYGGYYIDENTEDNLLAKIKEIETEHGGLVYAVIKNSIEEQTVYSFLYISNNKEDNDYHNVIENVWTENGMPVMEVFAYTWVVDDEYDSEFCYIHITSAWGGIRRVR